MDNQGKKWFKDTYLRRVAEAYFKKLYAYEDVGYQLQEMSGIQSKVLASQNVELMKEVTMEEVRQTTFSIDPHKCPGPDEMNEFLFQQFWDSMGDHIFEMVKKFFSTGKLEEGMNRTNICLIPKKH